jgi:hypothetical protein
MKKLLLIPLLLVTACSSNMNTIVQTGGIMVAAKHTGPAIVVPFLVLDLSAEQRAYNAANGIHHSREGRGEK